MSASLTVALNHTIAYLLSPLESTYPRSTLLSLADALHTTLTPRLAKHWSSPSRSARVLSFSPSSLPPKPILDAFNATATNWQLAVHQRASGRDFDVFVDPGCVSVSIAGAQRFTIWSEAPLTTTTSGYKPSTQELLAFDDDDELFSLIDKQVLSRSSLSAPSCADPAHAVDQLADMLSLFPSVPLTSTAFAKHNGVHLSAFHHSRTTSASSSVPSLSHSRSSSSTSATSSLSRSSSSSSLGENPHYNVNHPALLRLKALRKAKEEDAFVPPRLVLPVTPPQAAAAAVWPAYSPSTPSISPVSSVRTIPSPITPLSSLSGRNGSSSSLEFTSVVTPATPTAPCGPASPSKAKTAGDAAAPAKPKRNRRQRVHVDASRTVPTRYEGGRTTVLTGGTMLGPRSV